MTKQEFLSHAKKGHGECIVELMKGNINQYRYQVERVFLNNFSFLNNGEFRSAYAYKLISFYNEDYAFLNCLWNKLLRLDLNDVFLFSYLIDNLYFILKNNKKIYWNDKIVWFLKRCLSQNEFTINESNSISSLISLIYDLKLDISIDEIINSHFISYNNSNLDLSSVNYYYHKHFKSIDHYMDSSFKNMNISEIINYVKNTSPLKYNILSISHYISEKDILIFTSVLLDSEVKTEIKGIILQMVFHSGKYSKENVENIIKYAISCENLDNRIMAYEIILSIKNKKYFKQLLSENIDDSLYVMLALNIYENDYYNEVHKKIRRLKINYKDDSMWFEVEGELISYFKKRNVDLRLLDEVRYFLKHGLCSKSRLKLVEILKKYNSLSISDIENLKYDANCDIRRIFHSHKNVL